MSVKNQIRMFYILLAVFIGCAVTISYLLIAHSTEKGTQGIPGKIGATGITGDIGKQGMTGAKGDKGLTGKQGAAGAKGEPAKEIHSLKALPIPGHG